MSDTIKIKIKHISGKFKVNVGSVTLFKGDTDDDKLKWKAPNIDVYLHFDSVPPLESDAGDLQSPLHIEKNDSSKDFKLKQDFSGGTPVSFPYTVSNSARARGKREPDGPQVIIDA